MELKEVLKAKEIGEEELKVLSANMHLLSKKELKRFGFVTEEEKEEK